MSGTSPENDKSLPSAELSEKQLANQLRVAAASGQDSELLIEAADRIDTFQRFVTLVELLAPAGTAPRTAFEQIYQQSKGSDAEASPVVLDLRHMLKQHWGDWTPALREAEGLPPIVASTEETTS